MPSLPDDGDMLQSGEKGKSKAKGKGRKRKAPEDNQEDESSPEPMQATAAHDTGTYEEHL